MTLLENIFREFFSRTLRMVRIIITGIIAIYLFGLLIYLLLRLFLGDGPWWLATVNNFTYWTFLPLVLVWPVALILRRRWLIMTVAVPTIIAALWIGPYYLPKATAASSGSTLHVVTFNMYKYNPRIGDLEKWLRQQQADVVFLQEISRSYSRNGIASLRDIYPYQVSQPSAVRAWGNMVLSRYPIVSSENIDLASEGLGPQQRVYISVRGQTIALYNVHLAQPVGDVNRIKIPFARRIDDPFLRYNDTDRNGEINALLTSLEAEKFPYIVAGDFNTSDQGVTYGTLAAQIADTYREVGSGLGGSWPAGGEAGWPRFVPPLIRIDYIWHSPAFRALEAHQGPKLGSDHLPLVAALELKQTQ
jgi:endonuclease/exonuclease/phosphatase family metal-dependent hydrolase